MAPRSTKLRNRKKKRTVWLMAPHFTTSAASNGTIPAMLGDTAHTDNIFSPYSTVKIHTHTASIMTNTGAGTGAHTCAPGHSTGSWSHAGKGQVAGTTCIDGSELTMPATMDSTMAILNSVVRTYAARDDDSMSTVTKISANQAWRQPRGSATASLVLPSSTFASLLLAAAPRTSSASAAAAVPAAG